MRPLLITLLSALFFTAAFAQENKKVDSIDFCYKKYKVPENCIAKSQYEITDGNYRMIWIYMNDQMIMTVPEQTINSMQSQYESFIKTPVSLKIQGQEMKSYKISFVLDHKTHYQIISYGVINKMPVLLQLTLPTDINSDKDLPDFPRQLINFTN